MRAEAVDIFGRGDEIGELVGLSLVGDGELENNAVDGGVGVGLLDFGGDFGGAFGAKISNGDADVMTVVDFEIDVFGDDGIVAVADDEEVGFDCEAGYLVSLTLFDKAREFFAV